MRGSLKWLGLAALVYLFIRGMVPLIPMPINVNDPIHVIRTAVFFGISLTIVGTLAAAAIMAARSQKN